MQPMPSEMTLSRRIKSPRETPSPTSPSVCSPLHALLSSSLTTDNDSCHLEFLQALARSKRKQELREERKGLRWFAAAAAVLVISMIVGSLLIVPTESGSERRKPSLRSLRKRDGKMECVNGKQVSQQEQQEPSSSEITTLITSTSQIVTSQTKEAGSWKLYTLTQATVMTMVTQIPVSPPPVPVQQPVTEEKQPENVPPPQPAPSSSTSSTQIQAQPPVTPSPTACNAGTCCGSVTCPTNAIELGGIHATACTVSASVTACLLQCANNAFTLNAGSTCVPTASSVVSADNTPTGTTCPGGDAKQCGVYQGLSASCQDTNCKYECAPTACPSTSAGGFVKPSCAVSSSDAKPVPSCTYQCNDGSSSTKVGNQAVCTATAAPGKRRRAQQESYWKPKPQGHGY